MATSSAGGRISERWLEADDGNANSPTVEALGDAAEVPCPCGARAPSYYRGALYDLHHCACGRDLEHRHCCGAVLPAAPAVREWRSNDTCQACGKTAPEPARISELTGGVSLAEIAARFVEEREE